MGITGCGRWHSSRLFRRCYHHHRSRFSHSEQCRGTILPQDQGAAPPHHPHRTKRLEHQITKQLVPQIIPPFHLPQVLHSSRNPFKVKTKPCPNPMVRKCRTQELLKKDKIIKADLKEDCTEILASAKVRAGNSSCKGLWLSSQQHNIPRVHNSNPTQATIHHSSISPSLQPAVPPFRFIAPG